MQEPSDPLMAQAEDGKHSSELVLPWNMSEFALVLARAYPQFRREILTELANIYADRRSFQRFQQRWKGWLRRESVKDLVKLVADIQFIWKKPDSRLVDGYLNSWLAWRPSGVAFKKHIESAAGPDDAWWENLPPSGEPSRQKEYLPFRCSVESGRLEPRSVSLRAMLIQGVLENWKRLKICSNPNCPAPRFIARRADQILCDSADCKAEKQREHARNWWQENRAKNREAKETHIKKGRAGNGTRKAR